MSKAKELLRELEAEGTTFGGKDDRDTILAEYEVGKEIPVDIINKEFGRSFVKAVRIKHGLIGIDRSGVVELAIWSRSVGRWLVIQLDKKDLSILKRLM